MSGPEDDRNVIRIAEKYAAMSTRDCAQGANGSPSSSAGSERVLRARKRGSAPMMQVAAPQQKKARERKSSSPIHLSLVGIGVDLSVATVERISAVPGAKVNLPLSHFFVA